MSMRSMSAPALTLLHLTKRLQKPVRISTYLYSEEDKASHHLLGWMIQETAKINSGYLQGDTTIQVLVYEC